MREREKERETDRQTGREAEKDTYIEKKKKKMLKFLE